MKCQMTECGFTQDGLRVRAITDMAGSQVVVTDDSRSDGTHLLSEALKNHKSCISLAVRIRDNGIDIYRKWDRPIEALEFAYLCVRNISEGEK